MLSIARPDAATLGIMGTGHQAAFQLRAAAAQRDFERVVAWHRSADKLGPLANVAAELDLDFEGVTREQLAAAADVIVAITSCHEALLDAAQIRPGTHLSCMGTDTAGKQEIDPRILAGARVFADEPVQSAQLGECQHAVNAGQLAVDDIVPIGRVITGDSPGRTAEPDITVFDGTGVGFQDLAVARRVVDLAA